MVGMKSIAWKAGAAATLAATIVGLSAGQASADSWTRLHGRVHTSTSSATVASWVQHDFVYLEDACRNRGAISWRRSKTHNYNSKTKVHSGQAHLACHHK